MSRTQYSGDKPYYSLNEYLRSIYGEKVYKVSLDAGMTCPTRDGTIGYGGCTFCSNEGSGDFAADRKLSITEQINYAIDGRRNSNQSKVISDKFIAYFQAFTNTYAPIGYLRRIFFEAIGHQNIVGLSIGTRPDCLGEEVLNLLEELNQIKPIWIELGLQTIHDRTANHFHRGYDLSCFNCAVEHLVKRKLDIIVHMILGLPGETKAMMLESIDYVSRMPINGMKLHLLHILKNTVMAEELNDLHIMTMDEYIELVIECLEHIPQHIVIHRLTGDGPKDLLLAPLWSKNKRNVLNSIHKKMRELDSWQGKNYREV